MPVKALKGPSASSGTKGTVPALGIPTSTMHFLLVLCTLVLVPVNPSHSNHGTNTVLGVLRLLPAGTTASHSVVTLVPISPTTSTAHHRKAALLVVLQQHPSHPRYFVQDTRVCTYPVVNLKHADRNFEIRNSLPVAWHWHAPSGYPGTGVDFLPPGHGTRVGTVRSCSTSSWLTSTGR